MGRVIIIFAVMGLVGCATKAPKEDLRSVYQLVKERKFEEAESKLAASSSKSMLGEFDSYSGSSVKAVSDSGDYVIKRIQGTIEYCDKQIQEIKNSSDEEYKWDKFKLSEAKDEFDRHCSENEESVIEAQKISSVDFKSMFKELNSQFNKEAKRISTKLSQDEERSENEAVQSAEAKSKYEQSEEYYRKKLCEMNSIINTANSVIEREKEASQVSGYVDKKRMHEAGQAVTANRKRVQHFSSEYKNKFGKTWSPSACK